MRVSVSVCAYQHTALTFHVRIPPVHFVHLIFFMKQAPGGLRSTYVGRNEMNLEPFHLYMFILLSPNRS